MSSFLSSFVLPLAQAHPEESEQWLKCHFWKQDILQISFPPVRPDASMEQITVGTHLVEMVNLKSASKAVI